MIGNKLELKIIEIFNRDITLFLSINQIAKKLNKAYPHINTKVNEFIKEGIFNKVQIGRSYLCSINLESTKAVALLMLNDAIKKESFLKKQTTKFAEELNIIAREFRVYTIFLSRNKIYFVLDHIHDKEAIKITSKELRKSDLVFLSKSEFHSQIIHDKSLLNKTILYSSQKYYELLNEIKAQLFNILRK